MEGVASIDRIWPMTTPDGDAADRAAMSALTHRIGVWSRCASGNSGAQSRPRAGYGVSGSCRSATRPSAATSGAIESAVAACICICAVRLSSAVNGTATTIPEAAWRANVPSANDPLVHRTRSRVGHLEADTVIGNISDKHCVLALVDRKTGYVMIGKLEARTVEATNRRAVRLIHKAVRHTHTVTADNGTEFHGYTAIEAATGSNFYFAMPHHSWERGTSENTNGLIRQYLPKRTSMAHVTQRACNRIALKLNTRPRKRLGYRTPEECYLQI
jgi:hypothetical protein